MTLPVYQKHGYGRFLIEFSYLLSKRENMPGTPEKPLSDLGRISYESFWKSKILFFIKENQSKSITVEAISKGTGFNVHDIGATLQRLNLIRYHRESDGGNALYQIATDSELLVTLKQPKISVNEEALRWTPLVAQTIAEPESDFDIQLDQSSESPPAKSGPIGEEVSVSKASLPNGNGVEKKKKRRRRWNKTGYNTISRYKKRKPAVNGIKSQSDDGSSPTSLDKKLSNEAEEGDDEDEGDEEKSPYYERPEINSSTEEETEKEDVAGDDTAAIKNEKIEENGESAKVALSNGFSYDSEDCTKSN
jgi:hypothetical protein